MVDGMLGKLTRWLRILGHDVKYSSILKDDQLTEITKKEKRTLLTKDRGLYRQATRKRVKAYYVKGKGEVEKLAELAMRFGIQLDIDMAKSRCPRCNTKVKPIPKIEVSQRVKPKTFDYYNNFWECPKCKQVYWKGAHWKGIRKTLRKAKRKVNH